ncbi:peptide ABC transporter permease [Thermotoga maritima MSB8]|uniref:Oligopeptide ABC transporter, permease protein n=1 Tax=Thermotoga maritima (strain ATCC 43589 / DSM 3109 / JCM 10099 / NBRC 100826 / MSB8) TaxID=243274 RepID=Q9WXN6_THEMA|nr:ABC transporter permease [Thermotoga maritima]AAD35123.1 oligopeptide ABC transporter, permease protein [Thermotoga maritima MSB8]AGL48952.1 Beta-glucoside ABC transport system, permease protein 2 [Thermotoga maritima MSB8]AHD18200.1 peptide ABC transporter permease [Thermotoga maritima MSB8]AKE25976.1 peptide ABC transporter permease [Thermotoga maritima]AKE27838.1 peptide ABC transporter permease [Thermotoga maritima MSB8]
MFRTMIRPLFKNKKFIIGFSIFLFFLFLGIFGPMFYRVDPTEMTWDYEQPPSSAHPLGTDTYGRDVLAQLLHGIRSSLYIGFLAAIISLVIGTIIGSFSAVKRGIVDDVLMGITNIVLTTPSILIAILIASYLKVRSVEMVAVILGLFQWPWFARAIRAQLMSVMSREYVYLSVMAGYSDLRLVIEDLIPTIATYAFMSFVLFINGGIMGEAGLSLIGLGPTQGISLGIMLQWAVLMEAVRRGLWWWFVPPGLAIVAVTASLLVISTAMDEVFNPRLREE